MDGSDDSEDPGQFALSLATAVGANIPGAQRLCWLRWMVRSGRVVWEPVSPATMIAGMESSESTAPGAGA